MIFLKKGNQKKLSSWPDLVHGRAQWNFNRGHAVHVEAKYFRAGKSYHEVASHLLLVGREVAGFDAENISTRVAEHLLALGVPSHGIGVWLLKE